MIRFLRATRGKPEDELLAKEVVEACRFCHDEQKPPYSPIAALPRAYERFQLVAGDHFYVYKKVGRGLLLVDVATKKLVAAWVPDKKPSTTIDVILRQWIYVGFGAPEGLLLDTDPCFHNDDIYNFAVKFNISVYAIPPDSQWANPAERWIQVFKILVDKIAAQNPNMAMSLVVLVAAEPAEAACFALRAEAGSASADGRI